MPHRKYPRKSQAQMKIFRQAQQKNQQELVPVKQVTILQPVRNQPQQIKDAGQLNPGQDSGFRTMGSPGDGLNLVKLEKRETNHTQSKQNQFKKQQQQPKQHKQHQQKQQLQHRKQQQQSHKRQQQNRKQQQQRQHEQRLQKQHQQQRYVQQQCQQQQYLQQQNLQQQNLQVQNLQQQNLQQQNLKQQQLQQQQLQQQQLQHHHLQQHLLQQHHLQQHHLQQQHLQQQHLLQQQQQHQPLQHQPLQHQPLQHQPQQHQPQQHQPQQHQPLQHQPQQHQPLQHQPQQQQHQQRQNDQQIQLGQELPQSPIQLGNPNPNQCPPVVKDNAQNPDKSSYQVTKDWRILSNRVHSNGTTVEMLYTGPECLPSEGAPSQTPDQNPSTSSNSTSSRAQSSRRLEARPGVTRATINLPKGVLPTANCLPNMSSLINVQDIFAHPERHPPDASAEPPTTVTIIPDNAGGHPQRPTTTEVVPLGSYEVPPLEPGALNMAFQSFSLMNYKVVEDRDSSCTVFGSNESPNFLLTPHQQHRLQAAVLQQEIPLFDALLPIVHDLRMGVGRLPIVHPLPHATMQIHQGPPPNPTPLSGPPADPHYGSQYTYGSLPTPQVVRGPVSVPVSLPVSLPVPVPVPVPMPPDFSKPPPGYPFLPSSPDVVPMLPDLSKPPPNFKPVSE